MADEFFCPKGCGRDFKSNSAAFAHAHHCKFEAPTETDPTLNTPAAPELSPSDQAIVNSLTEAVVPQIEQGIAALQESVQINIIAGLDEALPQMVAKATGDMADKIAEGLKKNPASGLSSMMDIAGQINAFLDTPLGKIIEKKFMKGGGPPKGNINDWRRGSSLAIRMLGANKSDPDATAETIKEFAAPYKGKAGGDLYRGMHDTALMFRPAKKSEPETKVKPETKVEEKEKPE